LPGTASGLQGWIARANWLDGHLAQFCAVMGVCMTILLLFTLLRLRGHSIAFKFMMAIATTLIIAVVMFAAVDVLMPAASLALSTLTAAVTLAGAAQSLRQPTTRALGLALALIGVSVLFSTVARDLAVAASAQALASEFFRAQLCATGAFVGETAVLVLASVWLATRFQRPRIVTAAVLFAIAALLAKLASTGAEPGAGVVPVLLWRTLGELARDPAPVVPSLVRHGVELWAILLTLWSLAAARHDYRTAIVFALILPGRSAADVPMLALMLLLATLVARLPVTFGRHPREAHH
jgi:hypothetical protein